jgi:hypothetical protein
MLLAINQVAFYGVLIPLAILVYWYGNRRLQRHFGRNTEPRGRRSPRGSTKDDPQFAAMVSRMLQRGLVTPAAEAPKGPVMMRGVLTTADATLGGAPGRECVWRNRSDAPRDAAVAAEYVILADATGRVTIENLNLAEVVAPDDKVGPHRAYRSLLLGDEVEVVARFSPERFGEDPDPTRLVYGTLGADGNLHMRVARRDPVPAVRSDLPAESLPAEQPAAEQPTPGTTTS